MSFSASSLLAASFLYLLLLFGIAWITERGVLPRSWVRHPLVYTLSLGVYAGIWAVYASVGAAAEYGYGFLAYYLGISGAFLLAPVLLNPILRIGRAYQLTSLADLFAYRYRSQWSGTLVTLCSGAAILSLLSMQIKAVSTSASLLAPNTSPVLISVSFSLILMAVRNPVRRPPGSGFRQPSGPGGRHRLRLSGQTGCADGHGRRHSLQRVRRNVWPGKLAERPDPAGNRHGTAN